MELENESLSYQFYIQIRSGQLGTLDLRLKLAQLTNDYEIELLRSLSFDLGMYKSLEIEEINQKITNEDIEAAILDRINSGKEIPFHKRTKPRNPAYKLKTEPSVDIERLIYPYEFSDYYILQGIINKKLEAHLDPLGKKEIDTEIPIPESKSNPGRKKAEARPLSSYITGVNSDKVEAFLAALKEEFLNSSPKQFTHMILVLEDLEYLKSESRKELYSSFQHYFGKTFGSDTAKNNQYNSPDAKLLKKFKGIIETIKMEISYL